jgi:MFS family permease
MNPLSVLLVILPLVSTLSIDIYWPAVKLIQEDLKCSSLLVQLSMGAGFLLPAIIGLFYGSIADRYGRKPVLLFGILALILGNIGCAISSNINSFNFFRAIQGIGIGASSIIPSIILVEKYGINKATNLLSISGSLTAIGLFVAPNIGALLTELLGWRSCFFFVSLIALVTLAATILIMPETLQLKSKVKLKYILSDYNIFIKDTVYMRNIAILALSMGAYFILAVQIPFLYLSVLKMSPSKYAILNTISPLACFLISFFMRNILKKKGGDSLVKIGLFFMITGSIGLTVTLKFLGNNPLLITLFLTLYAFLFPTLHPSIVAKAINLYPDNKASAASLNYSFRTLSVWIGITIGSAVYNESILLASYYLLGATIFIIFLYKSLANKW